MGNWGGNNDDDESNQLLEQSIMENRAQIETQRKELTQRRIDIIKSQGNPVWTPQKNVPFVSQGEKAINDLISKRPK